MTAAQKTAKDKFKKAIAYRQKTGVSLKEAFAHIYGKKKVGGSGNSYIYKVYDRDSYGDPINNSFKKVTINASTQSDSKDKLYKKYPSSKYFSELQDSFTKKVGAVKKKASPKKKAAKKVVRKVVKKKTLPKKVAKKKLTPRDYDKRYQAKKPGKRITTGKNYPYKKGNVYYETRDNRSDKGKLLGIGKSGFSLMTDLNQTLQKMHDTQNSINIYTNAIKDKSTSRYDKINIRQEIKNQKKYLAELKTHFRELKKML